MLKDALTLSALIAAVLLVRAAFKNRVPKRLLYALWLVVLLKLCLPGTAYALPLLPAEQTAAVQQTEAPAQSAPAAQQPAQAAAQPQTFQRACALFLKFLHSLPPLSSSGASRCPAP